MKSLQHGKCRIPMRGTVGLEPFLSQIKLGLTLLQSTLFHSQVAKQLTTHLTASMFFATSPKSSPAFMANCKVCTVQPRSWSKYSHLLFFFFFGRISQACVWSLWLLFAVDGSLLLESSHDRVQLQMVMHYSGTAMLLQNSLAYIETIAMVLSVLWKCFHTADACICLAVTPVCCFAPFSGWCLTHTHTHTHYSLTYTQCPHLDICCRLVMEVVPSLHYRARLLKKN